MYSRRDLDGNRAEKVKRSTISSPLQGIDSMNQSHQNSKQLTLNRESYTDLKRRNFDIESRIKIMEEQRRRVKKQKYSEMRFNRNSSKMQEKSLQKKFTKIMRKDEKVENAIVKIQKDFMRYTQLKLTGFKTIMSGDRYEEMGSAEKRRTKRQNGGGDRASRF